ncbi:MAG: hypothetical protein IT429_04570 [Gemmataceae bacterium]|nr:hypothetical protein [Gemmataceae bacterium]
MNETTTRAELVPAAGLEPGGGLDLEKLQAQIRAAAARRREAAPVLVFPAIDWELLAASLARVERHADIAAGGAPDLPRFRGPLRRVGRLIGRVVLFLARFLTSRQREYNHAALSTLRNLQRAVIRLEEGQRAGLRRLREEMREELERKLGEAGRRAA